jgi:hypothetical protein
LETSFNIIQINGVYGSDKVMQYYNENKESVKRITRFDIFNLQYRLPRWMLKIPYDFLNRLNRRKLKANNNNLVSTVDVNDYSIKDSVDDCLDYFCIATK